MLNTIIETFKSFFSRAFWFASFLPLVIFASLHLILAWQVFPGIDLDDWLKNPQEKLVYLPVTFAALVVVGYLLVPVAPVLRRVLEGELLPEGLHDWLRQARFAETRPIREKMAAAETRFLITKALTDETDADS